MRQWFTFLACFRRINFAVSKLAFLAATAVAATTTAGAGGGAVAATRATASGREAALYDRSQKLINWTHARCTGVDILLPASCPVDLAVGKLSRGTSS